MSRSRLPLMVVIAVGLAVMRWWFPPDAGEGDASASVVVAAVERRVSEPIASPSANAPDRYAVAASVGIDIPGNAFSVRVPPAPPAPPAPPPPPKEKPFVGPPAPPPFVPPPPPPPPPLQVVGTWNDGHAPGVFVASPQGGTMLVRVGTVLLAEYRVIGLTPQHVAVAHLTSKHEWRLPIPRAGSRP